MKLNGLAFVLIRILAIYTFIQGLSHTVIIVQASLSTVFHHT
jgi:hypothetical protein